MTIMLHITCRDPVVARDGRPFGRRQGNRMRGLDWLLPSVLAGSLRTTLGKAAGRDFQVTTAEALLQVEVAGPFPRAEGQLYLPAPADCVVHPERGPLRAMPQSLDRGGCDWPADDLLPVGLTKTQAAEDFKPGAVPAWWPRERYATWLAGDPVAFDAHFLHAAETEARTHVLIDPGTGAAAESQLFTTAALALTHLPRYRARDEAGHALRANGGRPHLADYAEVALSARVRASHWCGEAAARLDALHPLGGERRLVHWKVATDSWTCPDRTGDALAQARQVRMVLATPAIFRHGWRPGWLNDGLVGTPPGAGTTLRLVGVSIQRWQAVSGWSLLNAPPGHRPGPKPVKRMVPAGGVYFFEVVAGTASALADRWLEPVSDDPQDRRDGFGLAVWGIW